MKSLPVLRVSTLGRVVAAALLALTFAAAGCKKGSSNHPDGGDGSIGDTKPNTDAIAGDRGDVGGDVPPACDTRGTPKGIGEACACGGQCASGFCADGVCCNGACTEGCKTCNAAGTVGMCVMRKAGDDPRDANTCVKTLASTCMTDGKCDGAGGCRKWPENTQCKPGTCDGDAVVGSSVCDGLGHCKLGSTRICVPFSCDVTTGSCVMSCTSSSQCAGGMPCVQGSCGKLTNGMPCKTADQCASNFCVDGVCCNVACQGACLWCNLSGREGRCWPLDADKPDMRGICHDQGPASCGQTGFCDGIGGCSKYPRDTQCMAPTCSGNATVNTAGTCNGSGSCLAGGIQGCHPFRCASGACTNSCTSAADCDTGIACVNSTCGLKQDGQACTQSSECQHNHCVDGICCDQACTDACWSCTLGGSLGRCTAVAAGTTEPHAKCAVTAQSTCSTNGKCDGSGHCQNWPVGTLCADESCTANVYKAPSTCNASGQCVAPDLLPCSPYVCNGTSRCFNACTNNSQCLTPNTCAANSCGLKDLGAACAAASECKSTFCAQGVCCDQACNSPCKSCVAGMLGVCSNVATGTADPTGMCAAMDQSTCGTNGKCEAGMCQRWASGTVCKAATCSSTTNQYTAISTCDGSGACVTPPSSGCFPYTCSTDRCNPTCTTDAQCQAPASCVSGSCGLKPDGSACAAPAECLHGFCEQGVCCQTSCQGTCKSCALSTSRGVCSNIPAGSPDLLSRCSDQGAASCGTDGKCDGKGACHLYDATTSCAAPSCPAGQSTAISGRTCNGLGVCQPATATPCAPYVCNGSTACLAACTGDGDCLPPTICDPKTNRCGNLARAGQPCTATSGCLTGLTCVDNVCCVSSSCPLCQACNVAGSTGSCANIPVGNPDTLNRCAANPPCGNTGFCNGAGGCQLAATTVSCGIQTCTGSTYTPTSHCTGTGTCAPATSSSCSPYTCATDTCRNNCSMDSHCLAPFTCQGTPPNRNCALKPNGTACTAGNQCISGNCVNGVCCGSAACGTCQTCNGTTPGTCTPLAAGTPAPTGQCTASPPCGNTGTCDGASGCTQGSTSTSCGSPVSCNGTTYQAASFCSGSGTCSQAPTTTCGNYICGVNACLTSCTSDAQCSSTTLYCTGSTSAAGSCVAKKANGATCGAGTECVSANCVDGVCCSTASCGTCQSCSAGNGTCANVANNSTDPHGGCPASTGCGNTGFCVNGACEQQPTSKSCGVAASCTGTTRQPPSFCSGTGTCSQTSTMDCVPYVCGANSACKTSCASDNDCSAGYYCAGTACMAKKALGMSCGAGTECSSGNCVDGACCSTGSCSTCQACNLNGAGTCSAVGTASPTADPHARCSNNVACGDTGLCVNGVCQQQASTTPCGPAVSCASGTYQPQSFCSGSGTCSTMSPTTCGNYVCNGAGTACLTSCNYGVNQDSECASGSYCTGSTNGTCQSKRTPGNSCVLGHECTTGNCVDGICCTSPSCGTCQTCGSGSCAAVTNGTPEPHNLCPANPPCGNTGTCTNGVCTQAAAGTECIGYFCASSTQFQPAATCNGVGGCSIPSVEDCSPYLCGAGACQHGCTDDSQCAGGTWCNGSTCVAALTGVATCSRDRQCGTGHCTEGYCCEATACPFCQSCAVAPTQGICTALPSGTPDTSGTCPNLGAASCQTNGLCNGAGNCQRYDTSTECSLSCDGTNVTHTYCDTLGTCGGAAVLETCASAMCTASGCVP
jgi:hypothetical protein